MTRRPSIHLPPGAVVDTDDDDGGPAIFPYDHFTVGGEDGCLISFHADHPKVSPVDRSIPLYEMPLRKQMEHS